MPCNGTRYNYTWRKKFLFWSQENYVILLNLNFKTWNMTELNVNYLRKMFTVITDEDTYIQFISNLVIQKNSGS